MSASRRTVVIIAVVVLFLSLPTSHSLDNPCGELIRQCILDSVVAPARSFTQGTSTSTTHPTSPTGSIINIMAIALYSSGMPFAVASLFIIRSRRMASM